MSCEVKCLQKFCDWNDRNHKGFLEFWEAVNRFWLWWSARGCDWTDKIEKLRPEMWVSVNGLWPERLARVCVWIGNIEEIRLEWWAMVGALSFSWPSLFCVRHITNAKKQVWYYGIRAMFCGSENLHAFAAVTKSSKGRDWKAWKRT